MLEPQTLRFLQQLEQNNHKPWFDAHRKEYEAARIDFQNFIQLAIYFPDHKLVFDLKRGFSVQVKN